MVRERPLSLSRRVRPPVFEPLGDLPSPRWVEGVTAKRDKEDGKTRGSIGKRPWLEEST